MVCCYFNLTQQVLSSPVLDRRWRKLSPKTFTYLFIPGDERWPSDWQPSSHCPEWKLSRFQCVFIAYCMYELTPYLWICTGWMWQNVMSIYEFTVLSLGIFKTVEVYFLKSWKIKKKPTCTNIVCIQLPENTHCSCKEKCCPRGLNSTANNCRLWRLYRRDYMLENIVNVLLVGCIHCFLPSWGFKHAFFHGWDRHVEKHLDVFHVNDSS